MRKTGRRKLNIRKAIAAVCAAVVLLSTLTGCADGMFASAAGDSGTSTTGSSEAASTGASSAAEAASTGSTIDPATLDPTAQQLYVELQNAASSLNGRLTRESVRVSFNSMAMAPIRDQYERLELDKDGNIQWYRIGRERRKATVVAGNTKPIDDALTFPFENVETLYAVFEGKESWTDDLSEETRELVDQEMLSNPVYLFQVFCFADKFFLDEEGTITVADVYEPAREFLDKWELARETDVNGHKGIELWCYQGTDGDNYLTDGTQDRPAEFAPWDDYIYYAEAGILMLDCFELTGVVKKNSPKEWHMRNANATENRMSYAIWADYAESRPSVRLLYYDKEGNVKMEVGINLYDMRWEKFKDFHQTAPVPPVIRTPDPPQPQPQPQPTPSPGPGPNPGPGPGPNPNPNPDPKPRPKQESIPDAPANNDVPNTGDNQPGDGSGNNEPNDPATEIEQNPADVTPQTPTPGQTDPARENQPVDNTNEEKMDYTPTEGTTTNWQGGGGGGTDSTTTYGEQPASSSGAGSTQVDNPNSAPAMGGVNPDD